MIHNKLRHKAKQLAICCLMTRNVPTSGGVSPMLMARHRQIISCISKGSAGSQKYLDI